MAVVDLDHRRRSLCEKADYAKGLAMQLRVILRENPNLPLPEDETDRLIRSLAMFVAASETYPR